MKIASKAGLLSAVAVAAIAGSPAVASASTPPTIVSSLTPNVIGVGGTTALGFTVTNPNSSGTLSSVAFTDTLPANVTVDDPNGENGTCGSASVVTANPGSNSISLSGGSLKAGASCTVSVAVTAGQPEVVQNQTGDVSSSAGASSSGSTQTLTVLAAPTVSLNNPRNNAKYTYGEVATARYSCAQPGDPQGLTDCSAQDDLGNTVNSGGRLNTRSPGAHTLSISATSSDGLVTTDNINYTVLPDNRFAVSNIKPLAGGALSFVLALPGPGKVNVREIAATGQTLATTVTRVHRKRRFTVTVTPRSTAGPTTVTVEVAYTPTGGRKRTVVRHGIRVS
ncbi:MAG: hypothetical protein ACLPV4_20310 [Solirubrobacteraceae bacterium]